MNQVFLDRNEVFRGYHVQGVADLELLERSQFGTAATERGDLVRFDRVAPGSIPGEWAAVVQHDRLAVISYPYEWSFNMLRDAALLQLSLTREALADGLISKDASPYNIQFVGSKPVFIDLGSFERLRPREPWTGYRQFCQMYLNPLLLRGLLDLPHGPWLRGRLAGITPGEMSNLLRRRDRWRPSLVGHVILHARAERRLAASERDIGGELERAGYGASLIDAQLASLTKVIERLEWRQSSSTWSSYSDRTHYTDADLEQKLEFVEAVVAREPRQLVWDLGANDGRFARVAARHSELVVAVDSDELVIDKLYKELAREGDRRIIPLVMDLIDSSPSLGWRGAERCGFYERSSPDVVLALALVHHLALPGNIPTVQIIDWLADLGAAEVVLEVPHENDPMVARLLRAKRHGLFDYTKEGFDREIRTAFRVDRTLELTSGTRTLYHLSSVAPGD